MMLEMTHQSSKDEFAARVVVPSQKEATDPLLMNSRTTRVQCRGPDSDANPSVCPSADKSFLVNAEWKETILHNRGKNMPKRCRTCSYTLKHSKPIPPNPDEVIRGSSTDTFPAAAPRIHPSLNTEGVCPSNEGIPPAPPDAEAPTPPHSPLGDMMGVANSDGE